MIIYPLIIILALVGIFAVVWRKTKMVEKGVKEDPLVEAISRVFSGLSAEISRKMIHKPENQTKEEEPQIVEPAKEMDDNLKKAEDLFAKKKYISAEKWYLESCRKNPKNPLIYSRLGLIYLNQKNYQDANDAFEEAIKLKPGSDANYYSMSVCRFNLGDNDGAYRAARLAMKFNPSSKRYTDWAEKIKKLE